MRKAHGLKIRINDDIKWNKIKGNNNMLKGGVELRWHVTIFSELKWIAMTQEN